MGPGDLVAVALPAGPGVAARRAGPVGGRRGGPAGRPTPHDAETAGVLDRRPADVRLDRRGARWSTRKGARGSRGRRRASPPRAPAGRRRWWSSLDDAIEAGPWPRGRARGARGHAGRPVALLPAGRPRRAACSSCCAASSRGAPRRRSSPRGSTRRPRVAPPCSPRVVPDDAASAARGAAPTSAISARCSWAAPDLGEATAERARATRRHVVSTYGLTETCGGVAYDGVLFDGTAVRFGPARGDPDRRPDR